VTGVLAYSYIADMAQRLMAAFPGLEILVYPIRNDFFGEMITVSGLLTGQDILAQLQGKELGRGLSQRPDGTYMARYVDRYKKRQTFYGKDLKSLRNNSTSTHIMSFSFNCSQTV